MDAEAIKHLAGICQLLGVVLVLQEVLAFARYRGELARAVACCAPNGRRRERRYGSCCGAGGRWSSLKLARPGCP
jgi:hypothetical protein